jgi:hypothetical protein
MKQFEGGVALRADGWLQPNLFPTRGNHLETKQSCHININCSGYMAGLPYGSQSISLPEANLRQLAEVNIAMLFAAFRQSHPNRHPRLFFDRARGLRPKGFL